MTGQEDPLADFPDWAWATLSEYTGASITQVRSQLKLYLAALGAIGYQLHATPEPDWEKMSEGVGTVLGDVASDREMGLTISFEQEVDLVVQVVKEALA